MRPQARDEGSGFAAEAVFGYLDWCRERGMSLEQTRSTDAAREYGRIMHRRGVRLSCLDLMLMTGRHREAFGR